MKHQKTTLISTGIVDAHGFRLNVGMVVINSEGKLFWGRRKGNAKAWQFPQGGMQPNETPVEAMYRELMEELGLRSDDVELLAETRGWLRYRLPKMFRRYGEERLVIGQRQKWFLLRLLDDQSIRLDHSSEPEFDEWQWVDYSYPVQQVIAFKRKVYDKVLKEFEKKIHLK